MISKWEMDDVYEIGCAFRIEAHEVQISIDMHSIIKYLCSRGARGDLQTKCKLMK